MGRFLAPLLLVGVMAPLLPPTAAWIPFVGEESHKLLLATVGLGEWDLLQMVVLNTSQRGVSMGIPGPLNATTFRLKEKYDNGLIGEETTEKVVSHLSSSLSFYLVYRQHNNTIASLFAAATPGAVKPWLQFNLNINVTRPLNRDGKTITARTIFVNPHLITSDLKRRRLQLVYHLKDDTRTHLASFPLPEKVGSTWTKVLVSVNATQVRVWVNCESVEKKLLDGPIDLALPQGSVLYFSRAPRLNNKLYGSVQAAKLFNFPMTSRLWRCSFDGQFGPNWKPPLIG